MMKREEVPQAIDLVKPAPGSPWPRHPALMSVGSDQEWRGQEPMRDEPASIGTSIVIKGELSGGEDMTIEGHVEGKIDLRDQGQVTGDLPATDKVDILENGTVEGDVSAPRVAIADGSYFRGSVDMQRPGQSTSTERAAGVLDAEPKAGMIAAAFGTNGLARV
jgi:cytoskeletal protein CcmA (bactofilin family)